MSVLSLQSYALGRWTGGTAAQMRIASAVTGETVAHFAQAPVDNRAMADFARTAGGQNLRRLTFLERAALVKILGQAIVDRKEELYALNFHSGATRKDGWIDIEGGAGTLFAMASKAKRELPDDIILIDGGVEQISREGSFVAQHVLTSLKGVAVHINAFNFPVWGMLEKLAVSLIAGVPAIVKPATATAYLAEAAFRILIETGKVPDGALQLIVGSTGDLFDHLTGQDDVSYTGSAATAAKLKSHPVVIGESVRFIAEQDSLNAALLAPDATVDAPEFSLFVKEVVREMTVKAGQKCTAIRRALVPAALLGAAETAICAALAKTTIGDPAREDVRMGALVSLGQRADVEARLSDLAREARVVFSVKPALLGADERGAFAGPTLLRCDDPERAKAVHQVEAFGPVATLMPYHSLAGAIALLNRGGGSLVMSLFTHDPDIAREVILGAGSFHGRVIVIDRDCARESTGHGSPLPVLVHGGPGRAGGGEEMGGMRGLHHYMQRTAVQGSPAVLTAVTGRWV